MRDVAQHFNPPPNWSAPPAGWTPPADWRPDPAWGPPPLGWHLWVADSGDNRRTRWPTLKFAGGVVSAFAIFCAGVAAGGGVEPPPVASAAESLPRATVTKTAEATVTAAPTTTATTATATETVKKRVTASVTATVTKKASAGVSSGGGGTDPRFSYRYEANDAGYGPYYRGEDRGTTGIATTTATASSASTDPPPRQVYRSKSRAFPVRMHFP